MNFVLMSSNLSITRAEYNQKQNELDKVTRSREDAASKLLNLEEMAGTNTTALSKCSSYKSLQALQTTYDLKKDELEADLLALKAEIDEFEKQMKTSTEKSCKFNLIS